MNAITNSSAPEPKSMPDESPWCFPAFELASETGAGFCTLLVLWQDSGVSPGSQMHPGHPQVQDSPLAVECPASATGENAVANVVRSLF